MKNEFVVIEEMDEEPYPYHDGVHTIDKTVELEGGGELHRFDNPGGAPMSAIYVNGVEQWNHMRDQEERMIRDWNDYGWKAFGDNSEKVVDWLMENARFEFTVRISAPANDPHDPRREVSCVVHCLQDNHVKYGDLELIDHSEGGLACMADAAIDHFVKYATGRLNEETIAQINSGATKA